MATHKPAQPIQLAWSALIESKMGADPLGLALRVGGRLTDELLYGLTSITPRARYFSFFAWCIADYRAREAGRPGAARLRDSIRLREHALVLGCVLHHGGSTCDGGSLTGSEKAQAWYREKLPVRPNLTKRLFSKNPAFAAYYGSMINLGLIRPTVEPLPDQEGETEHPEDDGQDVEEKPLPTPDDIELTALGQRVAQAYGQAIRDVATAQQIAFSPFALTAELPAWGRHGGLCEVRRARASDRAILREVFFHPGTSNQCHAFRRDTLLLLLHLADEVATSGFMLEASAWSDITYFGHLTDQGNTRAPIRVAWPPALDDIAYRWRCYHFHSFCWSALEHLFAAIVSLASGMDAAESDQAGAPSALTGVDLATLPLHWSHAAAQREACHALGLPQTLDLARLTPREWWTHAGFPDDPMTSAGSLRWDQAIHARHLLSEGRLAYLLQQETYGFGATILLGVLLLLSTLARYRRWADTGYGHWLFHHTEVDPYLDVTAPQILHYLQQEFPDFTRVPIGDLAASLVFRFVIRQHEAMAFSKNADGSRAFFYTDQGRLYAREDAFWVPKQENGRIIAAVRILEDLGYLRASDEYHGVYLRTDDGTACLQQALAAAASTTPALPARA